jgi:hypothetical protein
MYEAVKEESAIQVKGAGFQDVSEDDNGIVGISFLPVNE